ncbi:hypothetical protein ABK040_003325 [Willaertia magna]
MYTQEPKLTTIPLLSGTWQEQNGRIWNGAQVGNTFQWTQDARIANGIIVPLDAVSWAVFITFDGTVHWKLTPSTDTNQLIGKSDIFTRQSQGAVQLPPSTMINDVPPLAGSLFTENSGKVWNVTMHVGGYFQLMNQQDQRHAEGYIVRDHTQNGKFVCFINFHNPTSGDEIIRTESFDFVTFPLSNGDVLRRSVMIQQPQMNLQPIMPQPIVVQQQPQMNVTMQQQQPIMVQQPIVVQQQPIMIQPQTSPYSQQQPSPYAIAPPQQQEPIMVQQSNQQQTEQVIVYEEKKKKKSTINGKETVENIAKGACCCIIGCGYVFYFIGACCCCILEAIDKG